MQLSQKFLMPLKNTQYLTPPKEAKAETETNQQQEKQKHEHALSSQSPAESFMLFTY